MKCFVFLLALALLLGPAEAANLLDRDNLTAWCVVPFDAKKRGPSERAEMLQRLGFARFAYDWREKDVPSFDAEVVALQRRGIELTAWWFPTNANDPAARTIIEVIQRHGIHPQLWVMGGGAPTKTPEEQRAWIDEEAARIRQIVELAAPAGCAVELYNHNGWFGQPDNEVAVIERLKEQGIGGVGMVYNFSHAHADLADFPAIWARIQPHVVAVNVTGMVTDGAEKLMPPGQCERELGMLRVILGSGWRGPIGVIAEQGGDAEVTLADDLRGIDWLKAELAQPGSGGVRPTPGPGPLPIERAPLDPAAHPLSNERVNRDRIYDFYAKQARDFAAAKVKPALLGAYPGLDGGPSHWGNQTEASWRDERWNKMDIGSLQAGVFKRDARTVGRAVCVQLEHEAAACFDPDTLTWPEAWHGGFVRFDPVRFGMMGPLAPAGEALAAPAAEAKSSAFTYHGFYRHGTRVIFSYERDGAEWLESANASKAGVTIQRERAGAGELTALTRGGPAQWPQTFETRGTLGAAKPYAIDTITPPAETPWRSLWHFGGHDFFANGDAALCTMEGEVWIVSGLDDSLAHVTWRRFATGLAQALGVCVVDGKVCVLGRDQITRLHDLNGDGEADFYECFSRPYDTSIGGHDYITGLQRDADGRFYIASGAQGLVRTSADQRSAEVLGTGFRNPNGVGLGPNGEVTIGVQEGEWTPASMLYEIHPTPGEAPGHYGFRGPQPGPRGHLPPLAYFPRGLDNSCGGQTFIEGQRWAIPAGSLIHFSWGTGNAFLVLREQPSASQLSTLNSQLSQGTIVPLPGDFRSGAHRGRFSPRDGQLYVTGMTGWGTYTPDDGCFERMRYTGGSVQTPRATEAHANGILLRFPEPLDAKLASDPARFFAQEWSYRYSAAYGSEEYSVRSPEERGHDPLAITSAHLLEDGRAVFLEIPELQPANICHLHCELPGLLTRDFYLTLHQLGAPFTGFVGAQLITKTAPDPHAEHHAMLATEPRPSPWEKGEPGSELTIQSAPGLQFAQKELRAKPGERVSLVFTNPDVMPHNWVLVKPDAFDRIGTLAQELISAPDALARSYVPDSPEILAHTRLVDPQTATRIHFTAPATPGRYPYLCTFPGHYPLMRGELVVE